MQAVPAFSQSWRKTSPRKRIASPVPGPSITKTEMPRLIRSGTPARYWISLVTSRPSKNTTHGARGDRRLVLRGAKALAHLIIVTRAQIEGRGGDRMSRRGEALGTGAHLVGDRDAGVEPSLVVLGVLVRQRASDLVQLADVGA